MAFRIHDSVLRGEIDNRTKGVVRGRLWVHGRAEPVTLDLQGNAHPDLAGCLLTFENPLPITPHPGLDSLNATQRGTIGDLTASRKVRVYDIPFEEACAMIQRKQKPPEHMANSLYLEWFSEANGRVVVESADYRLNISAPAWRLTPEEDEQRARDAAAGMTGFMQKLGEAIPAQEHAAHEDKEWNEFDYEKFMKESDARTDQYMELLDKYGDDPNADEIIAKEMGWDKEESAEDDNPFDVEEMNRICAEAEANPPQPDPLTEGVDWIRTADDDIKHPLSHRALDGVIELMHQLDELDFKKSEDDDVFTFLSEYQTTGAKLAGALDSLAYARDRRDGAFLVAYLKRALNHLHKAQAGLEKAAPKKLLPEELVAKNRQDLFEIREEILRLMKEFRGEK